MKNKQLQKIAEEVQDIIANSKATFFLADPKIVIPTEEVWRELKEQISCDVAFYFYKKLNK
ncbi:MAG: hypothetical protein A2728_00150 [Candidatus Spechtbacteria bacterium RIFCSPHIGHO2_01_FULL_38_11]|nr:MAG: hypothetical protein A2728_00150 [Candidatus Spechtbacteria bacterium RIFCSPHIGHO2_01_FULL_38_11]